MALINTPALTRYWSTRKPRGTPINLQDPERVGGIHELYEVYLQWNLNDRDAH